MKTIFIVLLLTLTGCVSVPAPLSRSDQLTLTNREYPDTSQEQLLDAAAEVIRLIDPDDTVFTHSNSGFVADHSWNIYLVFSASFGTDTWTINVSDTRLTVDVKTVSGLAFGGPITTPAQGTFVYTLFWDRLDYLLGKRTDWVTCEQAISDKKAGKTSGLHDPMCGFVVTENELPGAP